ncbi:MAG TPA: HlyD family efflux transporter periplasmic adaptor subunit [Gemmatimonadales bacterium]|nr:HlyD family efflux transporter periplasmic adaptor subunit [Gemmatimonadales bacterium]
MKSPDADLGLPPESARLHAPALMRTPRYHWVVRKWLLGIGAVVVVLMFLPWQQYVTGKGSVIAYRPQDRPQVVNTAIAGRITAWHVAEGQFVRRGQPIITLAEIKDDYLDPATADRYGEQVQAKGSAADAKRAKVRALGEQIMALEEARELKAQQLQAKVEQVRFTVVADSAAVQAALLDSTIALRQLGAQEALYRDGLKSLVELEAARNRAQAVAARVVQARGTLAKTRAELDNAMLEIRAVAAEYADKLAKAQGDRSATSAEVDEARAEIAKLRNSEANVRLRNALATVTAPQDGFVVRVLRAGVGETVKEGEAVATVMPFDAERAVELSVKAMDVPLLRPGRKVRLTFDGWPALQFAGWPSVAVGTFGGIIAVIDQVNAPDGSYRILVRPDPTDEPWPELLRVGSGVIGWAMLDEVPIWYEFWRTLNSFPPTVQQPAPGAVPGGAVPK